MAFLLCGRFLAGTVAFGIMPLNPMSEKHKATEAVASAYQGYHYPLSGIEDPELTHVGRGTPCGELMRRYWQPVAMASEVGDLPLLVRILGEDLVLFRDGGGRYGLLHRHCAHRGASLEYGIVADRGLICCYHGWQYDVDGTLIKAGSEPVDSPVCKNVVQGAYPVEEVQGIVFAYMGPAEERPELPKYDTQFMDNTDAVPFSITTPCNWLQVYENTQDPIHVLHLHARSSGVQFGAASGVDQVIEYRDTPIGMINVQTRHVGDHIWTRTTDSILPNCNQTGAIFEEAEAPKYFRRVSILRWMVPVDDTTTRTIGWRFFNPEFDPKGLEDRDQVGKEMIDFIGQTAEERSYEDSQRQPGDFEAQVSQRSIAVHDLEHLATSDTGVARLRRLIRNRIRELQSTSRAPHPDWTQGDRIATYCQDTVWPWSGKEISDPEAEKDLLKQYGRRVADVVLESDRVDHQSRIEQLKACCEDINQN